MARSTSRAPLTRERVLRAALDLVDEHGLEALSMRKLSAALGVEAMSLYNHVQNKRDLVAGMLDLIAAEIEAPTEELDWRGALRAHTVAAFTAFVRRPWAARIWMTASSPSEHRFAQSDRVLRRLREAGLAPEFVYRAYHALDGYALGYALQRTDFPYSGDELKALAEDFLRQIPSEAYPDMVEHVRQHFDPAFTKGDSFEFGLDLILEGLERLRGKDAGPSTASR